MNDYISALRDSFLGLRATDSPVKKYSVEVYKGYVASRGALQRNLVRAEARKDNRLAALIKDRDRRVRDAEAKKIAVKASYERKSAQASLPHSALNQSKAEYQEASDEFEAWSKAVGRPPYGERYSGLLESIRHRFASESDGGRVDKENIENESDSFLGNIAYWLASRVNVLMLPFDIASRMSDST